MIIIISMTMTVISEYLFTLYNDVYGIMNATGHIFKFFSFVMLLIAFDRVFRRPREM